MTSMTPVWRKLALSLHVMTSVGWIGAVSVFLALGITAVVSPDMATVRAVYLVLEPAGWTVLVPLSAASLATGLIVSLGTAWGLLRYYWVIFKLVINLGAVGVLLLYMQTLGVLADTAASAPLSQADQTILRGPSVTLHAALALILLIGATVLAIYKPRGLTARGRRAQARTMRPATRPLPSSP